jgi:hypothetical protein
MGLNKYLRLVFKEVVLRAFETPFFSSFSIGKLIPLKMQSLYIEYKPS